MRIFSKQEKKRIAEGEDRQYRFVVMLFGIIFIIGLVFLGKNLLDRHLLRSQMERLRAVRNTAVMQREEFMADQPAFFYKGDGIFSTESETEEETQSVFVNPYAELFAENKDMVGWLMIPSTPIDYPVMQTPEDEEYYLHLDFYGEYNINGSLFVDTDSDVKKPSTNLLIHGHNQRTEDMFGTLLKYEEEEYGEAHPYIFFTTEEEPRVYQVMAVFHSEVYKVTDQVFKYYQFFEAESVEEFAYFYDNVKELSLYDTGVTAKYGDCFITLSTCSFIGKMGRFVVVGKEVGAETVTEDYKEYLSMAGFSFP